MRCGIGTASSTCSASSARCPMPRASERWNASGAPSRSSARSEGGSFRCTELAGSSLRTFASTSSPLGWRTSPSCTVSSLRSWRWRRWSGITSGISGRRRPATASGAISRVGRLRRHARRSGLPSAHSRRLQRGRFPWCGPPGWCAEGSEPFATATARLEAARTGRSTASPPGPRGSSAWTRPRARLLLRDRPGPTLEALAPVAVRGARSAGTQPATGPEMALAGDVVHLDADPVRIFEENRVVPRGELPVLRGMDDSRVELFEEVVMDRVDVLAAARAETEMVKAGAVLIERAAVRALWRSTHEDSGAAADGVDDVLAPDELLHPEEVTELLPERDAACGVVHGELDVRDAVHLDAHAPVVPAGQGESTVGALPTLTWSLLPPSGPRGRVPLERGPSPAPRWIDPGLAGYTPAAA